MEDIVNRNNNALLFFDVVDHPPEHVLYQYNKDLSNK